MMNDHREFTPAISARRPILAALAVAFVGSDSGLPAGIPPLEEMHAMDPQELHEQLRAEVAKAGSESSERHQTSDEERPKRRALGELAQEEAAELAALIEDFILLSQEEKKRLQRTHQRELAELREYYRRARAQLEEDYLPHGALPPLPNQLIGR